MDVCVCSCTVRDCVTPPFHHSGGQRRSPEQRRVLCRGHRFSSKDEREHRWAVRNGGVITACYDNLWRYGEMSERSRWTEMINISLSKRCVMWRSCKNNMFEGRWTHSYMFTLYQAVNIRTNTVKFSRLLAFQWAGISRFAPVSLINHPPGVRKWFIVGRAGFPYVPYKQLLGAFAFVQFS